MLESIFDVIINSLCQSLILFFA